MKKIKMGIFEYSEEEFINLMADCIQKEVNHIRTALKDIEGYIVRIKTKKYP